MTNVAQLQWMQHAFPLPARPSWDIQNKQVLAKIKVLNLETKPFEFSTARSNQYSLNLQTFVVDKHPEIYTLVPKHVAVGTWYEVCFVNFTFMSPRIVIDFFLHNQPDALIIQILFCHKTLHVSGIFTAHHQEFSTVHSALVSFMQVFDHRFPAESGWN
jgi:hypothetical protein